ncbi:hypothetical protein DL96DRAFT_1821415 [Flagelloscypha sp. PMI_526]|nr:hypothetical protein DL96DRAFT_1821415 [Flagelloscypha sp. PMI_526]
MLLKALQSNLARSHFSSSHGKSATVAIPTELWIHISQHLTDAELWSLRAVCPALYQAALGRRFTTLDLSYFWDPTIDGYWNSWETRLDRLEQMLKLFEKSYVASKIRSIKITPDVEYAFTSGLVTNPSSARTQYARRALRVIKRNSKHPIYDPPSYKEELKRVQKVTLRLRRLLSRVPTLSNIHSLTILAAVTWEARGSGIHSPPLEPCVYTASLLKHLSQHLVTFSLDLSEGRISSSGFSPQQLEVNFPQLETLAVHVSTSSLEYLPHIQRSLARSHRLKKVTLGFWIETNAPMDSALVPIMHNGNPISSIRTLEFRGLGRVLYPPLEIPLSPILPQLEHLLIDVQPSPSTDVISQLNTRALRTLELGQLGEEMSFPTFCSTFAGGHSLLEELTVKMMYISAGSMDIFPTFPRLKSLTLAVSDWNTSFLTRIPTCAPGLKSLSLQASSTIVLSSNFVLSVVGIYEDRQCLYLIKENIEQLECSHWGEWGLRYAEMIGCSLPVGGAFANEKLWTPMKAFAKKVPSLGYWMRDAVESDEAKWWP